MPARESDAVGREIEITPEIIEATRLAIEKCEDEFRLDDGGLIVDDDLLRIIFTAMMIAKKQ
jgi:hypothetical protein